MVKSWRMPLHIDMRGPFDATHSCRSLNRLQVPVWAVLDYTNTPRISRELLLCKVSILGPEYVEQQMSGGPTHSPLYQEESESLAGNRIPDLVTADGKGDSTAPSAASQSNTHNSDSDKQRALAHSFESSGASLPFPSSSSHHSSSGSLTASEALISKNLHLNAIKLLADQFGGKLVDVSENSVIVEMSAKSTRVDAFLSLMRPFGVLEAARSGE